MPRTHIDDLNPVKRRARWHKDMRDIVRRSMDGQTNGKAIAERFGLSENTISKAMTEPNRSISLDTFSALVVGAGVPDGEIVRLVKERVRE